MPQEITTTEPRPPPVATLKSWTPWPFENAHLTGHADIMFAGGWCVAAIPIFVRKDGTLSVGVPSVAQLDRDGKVKTDANGKRVYTSVITFSTDVARQRWQAAVLRALADAGINPAGGEGGA